MCWTDHFNTYDEACIYYGIETPDQLAADERYDAMIANNAAMDDIEARGGPIYNFGVPFDEFSEYGPF